MLASDGKLWNAHCLEGLQPGGEGGGLSSSFVLSAHSQPLSYPARLGPQRPSPGQPGLPSWTSYGCRKRQEGAEAGAWETSQWSLDIEWVGAPH